MAAKKKKKPKVEAELPAGRALELLVARLEEALCGSLATVERQARLYDYQSEQWKPVDVAVRTQVGSAKTLIIYECRDRGREQGDAWIDELASRRTAMRADKIIAVSQYSFTRPAYRKAEKAGVGLRNLRRLTPEELRLQVFGSQQVVEVEADVVGCRVGYHLSAADRIGDEWPRVALITNLELRCLRLRGGAPFSLIDLYNGFKEQIVKSVTDALPRIPAAAEERVTVQLSVEALEQVVGGFVSPINRVDYLLRVMRRLHQLDPAAGQAYAAPGETPAAVRYELQFGQLDEHSLPEKVEILVLPDKRTILNSLAPRPDTIYG